MIIVSNTGPLLHLTEAQCLGLLNLAGEVRIPPIVKAEFSYLMPEYLLPDWICEVKLDEFHFQQAAAWQQAGILDPGEAEALALSQQLMAEWFLTDDAAARLLGTTLGREVHGSLGIVLWAAVAGHLDYPKAKANLANLSKSSLWMSAKVLTDANTALERIFLE